jgi:hypothetical protein
MRVPSARSYLLILFTIAFIGCRTHTDSSSPRQNIANEKAEPPLTIRHSDSPTSGDSREPELNATPDGKIILSWVEKLDAKRYALRASISDGQRWSETTTVAQGDNWFVNWADFPSVIALGDGSLAAHWLVKSGADTYAYNVNIARSSDGGKTWSKPIVPHLDNTQTEHGFVSLVSLSGGMLGAIWLDGRNMKNTKGGHGGDKPLPVSMTLRYAAIDANGQLSDEAELDERVCECCQTSATVTSEGVVAVYRDRSQNEVRDVYSVRQDKRTWQSPQVVYSDNWTINGCPVNGPAVAADGRNVAVAWFTGAGGAPHVNVAFSTDAGASFGRAIQVDDGETQGRVDVSLLADGSALVCWLSGNAEGGSIKVRRVRSDGSLDPAAVLAKTDISRSSGFPRMARLGNEVRFAWTEFGKPSRIRMATADVSAYR